MNNQPIEVGTSNLKKYSLEFEIYDLPKMPNKLLGSAWQSRAVHAKKWADLVALQSNRFRPDSPLLRAQVCFTRVSSSVPDHDGLSGSFKAVADALVKCGIIIDDSPKVMGTPEYKWEKGKRNQGKIRVRVVEI